MCLNYQPSLLQELLKTELALNKYFLPRFISKFDIFLNVDPDLPHFAGK